MNPIQFKEKFKSRIFHIDSANFNEEAIKLFRFQASENPVYRQYIDLLGIDADSVEFVEEIPFLPISFFKTHKIKTGDYLIQRYFESSGTTGMVRSRHLIADTLFYEKVSEKIFSRFYGKLSDYSLLALLPSYKENPNSSLIYMIDSFMKKCDHEHSGYYDVEGLLSRLKSLEKIKKKILVVGVTYALMDFASDFDGQLSNCIVIETGGMKGRRKEMLREEVHEYLSLKLGVNEIHSEYGMTELLSQAWSKGNGNFQGPPWMKILVRDINDPFELLQTGKTGGINVIDLANVDSCAFIATEDLGRVCDDETFNVLGRFDNSDLRGCNLMYF
ncbi:MAG: acyl transferase [Cytophagaceae bacterium]